MDVRSLIGAYSDWYCTRRGVRCFCPGKRATIVEKTLWHFVVIDQTGNRSSEDREAEGAQEHMF
jgi:hypothetical protein